MTVTLQSTAAAMATSGSIHENAKAIVARVVSALGERDPAHLATYTANAAELSQSIDKLEAEIAATVAPVKSRPFIVFHDAYQYFERRFGLSAAGALTVSPEVPPGARRLTEIRHRIAGLKAVCVFAEPQLQSKVIASATEGTNAKSGRARPGRFAADAGTGPLFHADAGASEGLPRVSRRQQLIRSRTCCAIGVSAATPASGSKTRVSSGRKRKRPSTRWQDQDVFTPAPKFGPLQPHKAGVFIWTSGRPGGTDNPARC